jgi:carnitine O-acetyltransferase
MVMCLDDVNPTTDEEKARNIWHGNGANRFFDKPIQYIVAENGEAGFCGEHCMMDGTPTLKLTEWVLDNLTKKKINLGKSTSANVKATELKFNVNGDVKKMIDEASTNFDMHTNMHDLYIAKAPFGKDLVKKCKISPDAFCQMAIQYAFNNVTGERCGTYESCSTRKFLHGRTEVIRSCSTESAAFVDAMQGKGGKRSEAEIYALMQKAATQQSAYAKGAGEGRGVDRHLKGLQKLQASGQNLDIFSDKAYGLSSKWRLSTSTIASEHFDAWGFGEVVPDGYGIGYMAKKNDMAFTITSRRGRTSKTFVPLPSLLFFYSFLP